jgi:hypothetical protein
VLCTVCRWAHLPIGPSHFGDALLGILSKFQPEVLLPLDSSTYLERPLLYLRMSPHLQIAPAQHEIESRAAEDAVKCGNPAAVTERTSSPPRVTFTRSGRYLVTVPERKRCILPYLSDQCGSLDGRKLYRQNGTGQLTIGPIDKRCRTYALLFPIHLVIFFASFPPSSDHMSLVMFLGESTDSGAAG